jgi:hypothetical protein
LRKHDAAAEERARTTLIENGWQLRAGDGNPAVIVAESGERTLYGSKFAELVCFATERAPRTAPTRTREGRARKAALKGQLEPWQ